MHQGGMPLSDARDNPDRVERLSAIADRVTAVPLETNALCRIDRPEKVICSDRDVFVLCNNLIHRFSRNGNFQNSISLHDNSRIHDYAINSQQQLIILDRFRQVHFYTFDGIKRRQEDLSVPAGGQKLKHIAYYAGALWFTFERLSSENVFENGLLRFDLADRSMECFDLPDLDLGRRSVHRHFAPEFAVSENVPYVYSPFAGKDNILRDTLYLLAHEAFDSRRRAEMPFCIYPVRIDRRYLIASYCENIARESNFLFVFDRNSRTSFDTDGFRDDFFGTGIVTDIQPLNTNGSEYYFYKTGKDAVKPFPERSEEDNPVLFFVRLNG
jgi:hypothetical protein